MYIIDFDTYDFLMMLNKEINSEKIQEYLLKASLFGQEIVNFDIVLDEDDVWYDRGIRIIEISYDIGKKEILNTISKVDTKFLLWPFIKTNIYVISSDYELKNNEKLCLSTISDSNINFKDDIDMSKYNNYQTVIISNEKLYNEILKHNIMCLDDIVFKMSTVNAPKIILNMIDELIRLNHLKLSATLTIDCRILCVNNQILTILFNNFKLSNYKKSNIINLKLVTNVRYNTFLKYYDINILKELFKYVNEIKFTNKLLYSEEDINE